MTKQDFINYLSNPENLDAQSISALERLVKEYPWFQAGRLLYLKNLHNENSIAYEKNLHITSAYAPSGKVLYNLIKKKSPKKEVGSRQFAIGNEQPAQQQTDNIQYTVDNKQPVAFEQYPKLEQVTILQEMPVVQTSTATPKDNDLELLEKEMLSEAYRVSMTVDLLEETAEGRSQKSEVRREQPTASGQIRAERSRSETETLRDGAFSFGDWMKVVSGHTPDVVAEAKAERKTQKTRLIDEFILEQAAKTPPKPKAEFFSAENAAKKSLQDDETFVSETLAKIYLKQGNLPKALKAYEILMVKHPEKFHIFAPLLEKIKNLLRDQKAG